ncbi:EthD domain-containing protein [Paenarthrobacter sp. NPDC092416]|uniref:EthD domain-containing protein n=1 Tax=Paenarthrobacter sp. NPDC092416 TaxID=3364386 RepID=UPI0038130AD1
MTHIRQITLLQRKSGLSREEFQRYWLEVHAPLVRQLPHIISYTQHHVTDISGRQDYPRPDIEVDGIVEFVFAGPLEVSEAFSGPIGQKVLDDAKNFISAMVVLSVSSVPIVS